MLLWLEDWWMRSLSTGLPPAALPPVTPCPTQGRFFWRTRNGPCTTEMRTEKFLSPCHLCYCVQFPDQRATGGRKGFVDFTVLSHSTSLGEFKAGAVRQGSLLFHIALPRTKELTHSQRNIAGAMENGTYWLSLKRIKVGKREEEVTKKLNCLNFWKTGSQGKMFVCYFVYVYICVCCGGTCTHMCIHMWGKRSGAITPCCLRQARPLISLG